ncbi:MAG: FAD-dependent oxidoreductase [Actinomycetota bacterium]|nr:FAD-dependent oxidoreductase [Actinomycetota bacterium]
MSTVCIVGASLAGLTAAETLRGAGYDGELIVVDPSSDLPPDRPPLSKQVLAGDWEPDKAVHRSATRLPDLDVELRLGVAAISLDAATRTLGLSDGSSISADGIVLAMGAAPRMLFEGITGVHVLRTMSDCLAIRAELDAGTPRVAVVGAGFIGAEVAATCRVRGLEVTMIEAAEVPLGRVLPGRIGDFVTQLHRDQGVDVRLGVGVGGVTVEGATKVLALDDGSEVRAEVVVVGVGVVPNTGWLEGSGLVLDDGVRCDETCLAAPGIVAAGDVASWPNPRFGEVMRVEQWENAIEMGEHAARRLLAELPAATADATADVAAANAAARTAAFAPIPWFWSDQYDRKLQLAGRPSGSDDIEIVEGTVEERRFVALFRRGDRCTGVLGVNRPRHVMQARMKMAESLDWQAVRDLFA